MFKIIANQISARVAVSRTGVRSRRLPVIQMRDGTAIKISPGRSVVVSKEVLEANRSALSEMRDKIVILDLKTNKVVLPHDFIVAETIPPQEVPPEPVEEPPTVPPIEIDEVVEVKEEPAEEVPEEKPPVEEEPKPVKKPKRRSRAKKKAEAK